MNAHVSVTKLNNYGTLYHTLWLISGIKMVYISSYEASL